MRIRKSTVSVLMTVYCFVLTGLVEAQESNSWDGLTPLQTSKGQVELKLGPSDKPNCKSCRYKTRSEEILINYSDRGGPIELGGWNVPSDTVLEISVRPKTRLDFSELKIPADQLIVFTSDTGHPFYFLQNKGVVYKTSGFGVIEEIIYLPTASDNKYRCSGYFPFNPIGSFYPVSESFAENDLDVAKSMLDEVFLVSAKNPDKFRIYIIVYEGNHFFGRKYEELVNHMKQHVFTKRKMSSDAITFINGGRLENFRVDIFVIDKNYPSPVPKGRTKAGGCDH